MSRGGATINYLVLLLVILVGVAGGNLMADWIRGHIAAYRAQQPAGGAAKTSGPRSSQAQEPAGSTIPFAGDLIRAQQEQAREQRRRDRDGVRLARACEEWRQANAQLKSETAATEMKKHCGIYERYVQDGVLVGRK